MEGQVTKAINRNLAEFIMCVAVTYPSHMSESPIRVSFLRARI